MQIEILQGGIAGTPVYTESFAPTTNTYGLVNLEIGTGTTTDDFTTIDWANDTYFIRTSIDVTGGSSHAVMGTSQLMSVPYALHAKTAGSSIIDNVDDADNDPANEHNTSAQINGTDLEVTDGGGTVAADISSLATDVEVGAAIAASAALDLDTDPANELQDWTTLPGIPADFADDVDDVDDADANATNELQNIEQVLVVGNDANGNNIVNTGKIGIGTVTPNAESSMEIATALPVIFPSMTQTEVDALTSPVPGMVQYNTTANKLQVYSNQDIQNMIANELYSGTESGMGTHFQSVLPGVTGNIVAVEVLVRQVGPWFGTCDFFIAGQFFSLPISNYTSLTWHTFYLPTPVAVTAGNPFSMDFDFFGSFELSFATNSSYLDGSGCCFPGQDDMLFRIHIETPGGLTWVNMH
jgi:hypothetical protein